VLVLLRSSIIMLRRENVNLKSQFNRAIALIRDFAKGARVAFAVNYKAQHREDLEPSRQPHECVTL
jgi:hypothetical protein